MSTQSNVHHAYCIVNILWKKTPWFLRRMEPKQTFFFILFKNVFFYLSCRWLEEWMCQLGFRKNSPNCRHSPIRLGIDLFSFYFSTQNLQSSPTHDVSMFSNHTIGFMVICNFFHLIVGQYSFAIAYRAVSAVLHSYSHPILWYRHNY